jgi:arylsulfatase A-like enzyme
MDVGACVIAIAATEASGVAVVIAVGQAPRSFPSFLTSRLPSQVKWWRLIANFSPMAEAPENKTFFEALHEAGYYCVGEFSHFYLTGRHNIHKGFDDWHNEGALTLHDSNTDVAAPRVVDRVVKRLEALKKADRKFVLWTHLFEPHSKYMDHPERPVKSSGMKAVEERYDGEVFFDDLQLQRIYDTLARLGLDKNTMVVLFSDHGEAFGEHKFGGERMYFHGQTIYDELLRVPLLFRIPGMPARSVEGNVALMDLGPTILDLVKAERPPNFRGRSLLPAMLGEPLEPQPILAELLPTPSWAYNWRAMISGTDKIIDKLTDNTIEVYDLAKDPTEQENLARTDPDRTTRLKKELSRAFAVK